ncbi:ATP-binding protein [Paraeggerthella hongkongensis]|uniref:Ferredoxin n=1 Tax=Paraeggerthella hongkongensis TaxID=230658 RepID=A0A3N0BK09_9ACTN|nr:4Fe-4S dicluster domain-containing protein [Paraeggerthella hongkongensis]RNL48135.1 ferredoxin [Paraeggerthella hongkongensis]
MAKKIAVVAEKACIACGACAHVCPREAVSVWRGTRAYVNATLCVGCGACEAECPASAVTVHRREAVSA